MDSTLCAGSSLASPAFVRALHCTLRTLIEDLGCSTFNVGIHSVDPAAATHGASFGGDSAMPWDEGLVHEGEGEPQQQQQQHGRGPIVARVVSRGKLGHPASDFGALEVLGGASIGHTDPYRVIGAIGIRLQAGR